MKDFILGFFVAAFIASAGYIIWENHRHIPVLIKEVPVPVQMQMGPNTSNPDIKVWNS